MKKKLYTDEEVSPVKKPKLNKPLPSNAKKGVQKQNKKAIGCESKFTKTTKGDPTNIKEAKLKSFSAKNKTKTKQVQKPEKVEDWGKFKRQKKELKLKRKQTKNAFDVIIKAKKIGENLRRKSLKGGEEKRSQLINELHNLLKGKVHYPKFVLAHDTARLVQWLLKYASNIVIQQISKVTEFFL